jgi:hypothetical protein
MHTIYWNWFIYTINSYILNSWFRASWFNINKKDQLNASVRRHLLQRQTLHVSGVTAPILRSSINCIRYLWYRSWYWYRYFLPPWPDLWNSWGWALWRPKHVEFDVAANKCLRTDASSWSLLLILTPTCFGQPCCPFQGCKYKVEPLNLLVPLLYIFK